MLLAEFLAARFGLAGRLPSQIDDLRGPIRGVVTLPRHLSWPGRRECDLADDETRRGVYGLLLTQGKREDIVRFVNGELLRQDWPLIKRSLEPRLGRLCERHLALGHGVVTDARAG